MVKYDFRYVALMYFYKAGTLKKIFSLFRMNAKVPASDEEQVKALLQHGERMLKELKQNVDLATAS